MGLVDPVEVLQAADEVEVGAPGLAAGGARRLEVPLQQVVVRFLKRREAGREEMRIASERWKKKKKGTGRKERYDLCRPIPCN